MGLFSFKVYVILYFQVEKRSMYAKVIFQEGRLNALCPWGSQCFGMPMIWLLIWYSWLVFGGLRAVSCYCILHLIFRLPYVLMSEIVMVRNCYFSWFLSLFISIDETLIACFLSSVLLSSFLYNISAVSRKRILEKYVRMSFFFFTNISGLSNQLDTRRRIWYLFVCSRDLVCGQ